MSPKAVVQIKELIQLLEYKVNEYDKAEQLLREATTNMQNSRKMLHDYLDSLERE